MLTNSSTCLSSRAYAPSDLYARSEKRRQAKPIGVQSAMQLHWTLGGISAIALSVSTYLAWVAFSSGKVAGCGSGDLFDCSHILNSRWSTIFGMPVSVPAVLLYASALALLLIPSTFQRLARFRWSLMSLVAFSAGFGAIWFMGLQILWLQELCPYCLGVHLCGLAMAGIILWKAPAGRRNTWRLAALAILPVAFFVAGQILVSAPENFELIEHEAGETPFIPATTDPPSGTWNTDEVDGQIFESPLTETGNRDQANAYQGLHIGIGVLLNPVMLFSCQIAGPDGQTSKNSREKQRGNSSERSTVKILNGITLDVAQWPLIGKPDAKYVFVEMFDYTCQHCQITHAAIRGAMDKYGDQLAVIVLPVPINASCNAYVKSTPAQHSEACELAKVAIAVWRLEPTQFGEFHDWLFESKPNYSVALNRAAQIAGQDRLKQELQGTLPSDYIAKNVKLYQRAGTGAIPKLLFPTASAVGEMRSADTLIALIEKQLGKAK